MADTMPVMVFDRTQADIDMALALIRQNVPLPADNLKIAWDWRALKRIEQACEYLANLLNRYGYNVSISVKTDWNTESTGDFEAVGRRIIGNINALRKVFTVKATTPDTPLSIMRLNYTQANAIEQILFDMNLLLENMLTVFIFSGETYSGESDFS